MTSEFITHLVATMSATYRCSIVITQAFALNIVLVIVAARVVIVVVA